MTNFAIIGFGHIGQRHARHIQNNPNAQLVAVCDIDAGLAPQVPDNIPFFSTLDKMLRESSASVVNVCTPNYLHCPHAIEVLSAGRHALIEKPMALNTRECDNMIEAAENAGKSIFAVKQNRYNPPVCAVKDLMENNQLGEIYLIQVNCFWNRNDAYYQQSDWRGSKDMDGGCLFTQFSHFVDILYYLNGEISEFYGRMVNYKHQNNTNFEDSGVFSLKAKNGALVNFNFTTCAYEKNMEGSITIFAEKGTVKIGGQYLNTIDYQNIKDVVLPQININARENDYGLYKGSMSNHDKIIQNVIDVLEGKDKMMTTAEDGRNVVGIIEKMYAAAETI